jgi:CheY-like chemotaxis protein
MIQPLALVLYERILPGSQLVNRLQDLKYRVHTITDPARLVGSAEEFKPMLVLADLEPNGSAVCEAIAKLKQGEATSHLPVIVFGAEGKEQVQAAARAAGVTLIVGETALRTHLDQFLEQALQVE